MLPLSRPDLPPDHIRNCTLDRPFNQRNPGHHAGCGKLSRRCERQAVDAYRRERRIRQIAKATREGRSATDWIPKNGMVLRRR